MRIVAIALLMSSAAPAVAQTQAEYDAAAELAANALEQYRSGAYAEAGAKFLGAYEISKLAVQLKNAAKAYDRAEEPATALSLWRRYAALDEIPSEDRAKANQRIEALESELVPPPPPPPVASPPPPPPPPPSSPPVVVAPEPVAETIPVGAYVALGAGAAAVIAGVVLVAVAANRSSDLDDRLSMTDGAGRIVGTSYDAYVDSQNASNRDLGVGGGLMTAGAVAVGVGAVLLAF